MYLLKQWRESRILTGLAILALALLLIGAIKGHVTFDAAWAQHPHPQRVMDGTFAFTIGILYAEAVLVSFWGWLAGGIGAGKNLGEDSGSFLFTRPRRRAWFLWNDWGYAMAQIAAIILLTNLIFGFWVERILASLHSPWVFNIGSSAAPIPLLAVFLLISIAVLLVAGLVYSISYFSTIVLKRTAGVMLGAGILLGYLILRGVIHHYYGVELPSLIMRVFDFGHHSFHGIAGSLGLSIAARTLVMLAFPFAAQLILDRSEI